MSDLMAGLMMVFLFIAIIYTDNAEDRIENVVHIVSELQDEKTRTPSFPYPDVARIVSEWQNDEQIIYNSLRHEFKDDLARWQASIQRETLTIRFKSPEILFASDSATLKPEFKSILDKFIPRYIALLYNEFQTKIQEVRIEGHTSSEYGGLSDTDAFIVNMELSQRRTRSVLQYALGQSAVQGFLPWMRKTVSANGLSSARPIMVDGVEDKEASRRVEFTIRTKTRDALFEIMDELSLLSGGKL